MTQIAKTFHVLPSIVAANMDEDHEDWSITAMQLIGYAQAKAVSDRNNSDELKEWEGSKLMKMVDRNSFELHKERMAVRAREAEARAAAKAVK